MYYSGVDRGDATTLRLENGRERYTVATGLVPGTHTVTVSKRNTGEHNARMSLEDFSRRNWDYDAEKIGKRNSEWSD